MIEERKNEWFGCPYYSKCKESKLAVICETPRYNQCDRFERFLIEEYYP